MSIILLADVVNLRARQRKELSFYTEKKAEIERKLATLHRDLQLTDHILKLIQGEHKDELSLGRKDPT
jgi:hypothetical protein